MAASFVADLFTNPITSVTSSTTIAGSTNTAVSAGDSVILSAGARGGTTTAQSCSLSGLPGDAVVEKSPDISASGSPAVQQFRIYLPSGMSSGTTITGTWVQSATRKAMDAVIVTGLANSNGIWQTATPGGTANLTAGTTAATSTTTGWHSAAWWFQSTSGTLTVTPGSDVGGTMTERCDQVVGASQFGYLYMEDRPVSASTSGETATATISAAAASSVGVQGVWDGAAATANPRRTIYGPTRRVMPVAANQMVGWR